MLVADRGLGRWLMGWLNGRGDWAGVLRDECVRLSDLESDALCLHFPITCLLARHAEEEKHIPAVKCEEQRLNSILAGADCKAEVERQTMMFNRLLHATSQYPALIRFTERRKSPQEHTPEGSLAGFSKSAFQKGNEVL